MWKRLSKNSMAQISEDALFTLERCVRPFFDGRVTILFEVAVSLRCINVLGKIFVTINLLIRKKILSVITC